jgi:ribosome-binding protein aMBF1 (putative translation factor)
MEDARKKGLSDEDVAHALDIEAQEIRRIMDGLGVSEPAVWEKIRARLIIKEK